jgi:hypothetical protein
MVKYFHKNTLNIEVGKCLPVMFVLFLAMSATTLQAGSLSFFSPASCTDHLSGEEGSGSMIAINGYSFEGEYLIINYKIQYPGMTKVKMFDNESKQLLWRSQYVNDKEGNYRIVLRRKALSSGTYMFEFDYKNQKRVINVSV